MTLVFIVGVSGTGKHRLLLRLQERGWNCADLRRFPVADSDSFSASVMAGDYEKLDEELSRGIALLAADARSRPGEHFAVAVPELVFELPKLGYSKAFSRFRICAEECGTLPVCLQSDLSCLVRKNGLFGAKSQFIMPRRILREKIGQLNRIWDTFSVLRIDTSAGVEEAVKQVILHSF